MNDANINLFASLSSNVRYNLYAYKKKINPKIEAAITLNGPTKSKTHGNKVNGINNNAESAILNAEVFDFPDIEGNK